MTSRHSGPAVPVTVQLHGLSLFQLLVPNISHQSSRSDELPHEFRNGLGMKYIIAAHLFDVSRSYIDNSRITV